MTDAPKTPKIKINSLGRAVCPFCGKDYALPPSKHAMGTQGIWAHIKAKHKHEPREGLFDDLTKQVKAHLKSREEERQVAKEIEEKAARLERKEEREAPLRKHIVTGGFLIEVKEELLNLIDMMEPYYKQGYADEEGWSLVHKLEALIKEHNT